MVSNGECLLQDIYLGLCCTIKTEIFALKIIYYASAKNYSSNLQISNNRKI